MLSSNLDVSEMFVERQAQRSSMHARHLNEQLVRVLKTIGYDVGFQKGQGQYLFDRDGARYLDLLSGFGVFAIGRNHPALRQALKSVLDCRSAQSRAAGRLDAGRRAGGTSARTCAISGQGVFCQFRRRDASRPRSSSPAARPAGPASSTAPTPFTDCPTARCR